MSVKTVEDYAVNADAPAPAATYQTRPLELRRDLAAGIATQGTIVDVFIFHEAQQFDWFVEGSETGNPGDWWVLATAAAVPGHVAGAAGTLVSTRCPFSNVRVRVTNGGAAPATNFRVKMASQLQS